jgi:hypothetical protein
MTRPRTAAQVGVVRDVKSPGPPSARHKFDSESEQAPPRPRVGSPQAGSGSEHEADAASGLSVAAAAAASSSESSAYNDGYLHFAFQFRFCDCYHFSLFHRHCYISQALSSPAFVGFMAESYAKRSCAQSLSFYCSLCWLATRSLPFTSNAL